MRILAVIAFVVFAVGCSKKSLDFGLDVKETIRANLLQEPPTLDWNKSEDSTSHTVELNIMDGLVGIDYHNPDLPAVPDLATEWKSSPDGLVWTFTLRRNVHWTDGVEFTGQQVLDGWERLLNPKTASAYAYIFNAVHGADAYMKGELKDFSQVGFKLNERGQVVVTLDRPQVYFPYLLTMESSYPIRKDLVEKFGDHWTDPKNIVTLGPYKLKRWDHDKAIVLERNDNFFGDKALTKNILFYMIVEYSTAVSLYRAGRLDLQETIPFNEIPAWKTDPGFHQVKNLGTFYYGFNVKKPPFNEVLVRRAFSHAIDRKQITDLLRGGMTPMASWVPPGMPGYEPDVGPKFDAALANKLLDEAGYKDRSKFPRVVLGFNTNENHQRVAENIQQQILKNLGVRVDLSNSEWKVYLSQLKTDAPNLFRFGWLTDYPDPDSFMTILRSNSEQNNTGWKNKEYDELVSRGASELDKNKRREIYLRAQKLLTEEEAPVIALYSYVYTLLITPRLKNPPLNAMERLQFKDTSIQ